MAHHVALGQLAASDQERDAVHIAVLPVIAAVKLKPGAVVGLDPAGLATPDATPLGVVDPFLGSAVKPGERFWLCLYPNTVTNLRHAWTHPGVDTVESARDQLRDLLASPPGRLVEMADRAGLSVGELMEGATEYLKNGTYLSEGGRWEGFYLDDSFWDIYEAMTKTKVPFEQRGSFFSCSC